jgi:preprotein translocase subunit SecD
VKAKLILLTAVAAFALAAPASVFEVHVVEPKSSAKTKAFTIENAGRKETVNLNNDILLDRSALIDARGAQENVSVTNGGKTGQKAVAVLKLTLTSNGKNKLTDLTAGLVGKQVGVVVDGKLIATPAVREGLKRSSISLTGNFTKEEADALAAKINSGK